MEFGSDARKRLGWCVSSRDRYWVVWARSGEMEKWLRLVYFVCNCDRSCSSSQDASFLRDRMAVLCARIFAAYESGEVVARIFGTLVAFSFCRLGRLRSYLSLGGDSLQAMGTGRAAASLSGGGGAVSWRGKLC